MSELVTINNQSEWDQWATNNFPNRTLYIVPSEFPVTVEHHHKTFLLYHLRYNLKDDFEDQWSECGCELHQEHRKIQNVLDKWNVPQEVRELMNDLEEKVDDLNMDKQYYESIMDGSWPLGREILEDAIRKYPD